MPLANENKVLLRVETAWTSSAGRAWLGFSPYLLTLQELVQGITCTPALQPGVSETAITMLMGLSGFPWILFHRSYLPVPLLDRMWIGLYTCGLFSQKALGMQPYLASQFLWAVRKGSPQDVGGSRHLCAPVFFAYICAPQISPYPNPHQDLTPILAFHETFPDLSSWKYFSHF